MIANQPHGLLSALLGRRPLRCAAPGLRINLPLLVGYALKNGVRRRIRKKFSASTRNAVRDKLTKALRDQQIGVPIAPDKQTVGQFLESWLQTVAKPRVRPSTFQSYEWIVRKHLSPGLGKTLLSKLGAQQVQTLLEKSSRYAVCPVCETDVPGKAFEAHYAEHVERPPCPIRV